MVDRHFLPKTQAENAMMEETLFGNGKRNTGTPNLSTIVRKLLSISDDTEKLLGLFTPSHMSFDEKRDPKLEPSLKEMTDVAIRVLSKNKKGYILMVEEVALITATI